MLSPCCLSSFSGHPLKDGELLRYIYSDESGTNFKDKVSIVAGIILKPDFEWKALHGELERLKDKHVPKEIRDGFVFHAQDVFQGTGPFNRNTWSKEKGVAFIYEVLSSLKYRDIGISVGYVPRKPISDPSRKKSALAKLDHLLAWVNFVSATDGYLRELASDETATLVVEDCQHMRKLLNESFKDLRDKKLPEELLMKFKVEQIIDTPNFQDKDGAPLLQYADACAFSMNRYFSRKTYGRIFMNSLFGTAKPFGRIFHREYAGGSNVVHMARLKKSKGIQHSE